MAGTRQDGLIDEQIILQSEFRHNGALYDPFSIDKVEIYPSYDDAVNNTNKIEEIASVDITKASLGLWEYIVAALSAAGTYFDKIYYVPLEGYVQEEGILPFYVRKESFGIIGVGEIELCRVTFYLKDIFANADDEDEVTVKLNREWAWYGKHQIRRTDHLEIEQDDDGRYTMDIIETTTMTTDTKADVYYILKAGRFEYRFMIPKGTIDAWLKDLPVYS